MVWEYIVRIGIFVTFVAVLLSLVVSTIWMRVFDKKIDKAVIDIQNRLKIVEEKNGINSNSRNT